MFFTVLLGLAVYRLSLLADDPAIFKKLKKIHEHFAISAYCSIYISLVFVVADYFLEQNPFFRVLVTILALSGFSCVLNQLRRTPPIVLTPFPGAPE